MLCPLRRNACLGNNLFSFAQRRNSVKSLVERSALRSMQAPPQLASVPEIELKPRNFSDRRKKPCPSFALRSTLGERFPTLSFSTKLTERSPSPRFLRRRRSPSRQF